MKQVFKYYFQFVTQSITTVIWLAVFLAVLAISHFVEVPVNQQQNWSQNLVQLQSVLLFCWAFLILQVTYWACHLGYDVHVSRLCLWWEANGIRASHRLLGQLSALMIWSLVVGWIIIPISYAILTIPIHSFSLNLILEHSLLYFLASLVLITLGLTLSPLLKPTASFLLINLIWFTMMFAGDILRDLMLQFPYVLQTVFGFVGIFVPPFTLLFRPGALFYQWDPLSLGHLFGIIIFVLTYVCAVFFIGVQTNKPKKF
jgi:hypothetical protein